MQHVEDSVNTQCWNKVGSWAAWDGMVMKMVIRVKYNTFVTQAGLLRLAWKLLPNGRKYVVPCPAGVCKCKSSKCKLAQGKRDKMGLQPVLVPKVSTFGKYSISFSSKIKGSYTDAACLCMYVLNGSSLWIDDRGSCPKPRCYILKLSCEVSI